MEYNLNFMHPIYGTIFNADIDGNFTVAEMTENLVLSGFVASHQAGYQLALGSQVLEPTDTFMDIEGIDDGVIIRVVQKKVEIKATTTSTTIAVQLIHPNETLILPASFEKDTTVKTILDYITQNNIVEIHPDHLALVRSNMVLDIDKTLSENQIEPHDYIKIVHTQKVDIAQEFQKQFQNLEQQLQQELKTIKENMPAANLIPVDPTRAVNPTQETYESIDTIVNKIQQVSGQKSIHPITITPTRTFLIIGITILILTVILLTYLF